MKFFVFCAHVKFLAMVASAPVDDNHLIIGTGTGPGTGDGTAVCDITKGDCSLSSYTKDYTISSADSNEASDGAGARVGAEVGAGSDKPSIFLNLFAANSDFSTSSTITPWTGSDLSTYNVAGNPPDTVNTPTNSYPTYDCDNPWRKMPGATDLFLSQAVDGSFTAEGSGENYKRSPGTSENILQCIKCEGPQDEDCKPMVAICQNLHSQCNLCPESGAQESCEFIEEIMRLPSRTNPKGQSWCNRSQCQQRFPT
ncbi:hypothetical protein MMC07_001228 [Pseudocyphellaria aurata]|nr:hypothetical protein [Pseudocyphellaria aurata]